jgi:transposase-like protein
MVEWCCQSDGVGSLKSWQTMEAYAVRRTVAPSAEIQASIDKLMSQGMVDDLQKMLSELARLGARLIIQRAVEEEFDTWLGRARYERRPERQRGLRNGFRPRRLQTGEGELRIEIPQAREAAGPFVSKLFPKWHCKRLLPTDPLKGADHRRVRARSIDARRRVSL